ncbi:hypothetical protein J8281_15715 [Aquimarina sp. U1-2]|uniref:hypothetical protein n=1 Tax=Aquimarina sp. U1-2 TaxID=2823141 RepID=UPI001AEC7D68|nr:hypothetical protein [Aquimarina sp. U1-2]MBP2833643.1 hypothetical protein [Aquimarina sp. U1-2]
MRIWGLLIGFCISNSIHAQLFFEENDIPIVKKVIYEYFDTTHSDQMQITKDFYSTEEDQFLNEVPVILYERISLLYDTNSTDTVVYEQYEKLERIVLQSNF